MHQPVGQSKVDGLDYQPRHDCKKRWEVEGSLCGMAEHYTYDFTEIFGVTLRSYQERLTLIAWRVQPIRT
ncbi:MAG: hypothetical protein P8R03_06410 [Candidatus Poseidoniaceae archaeon]|nr:hypothetical protein [Candidatus Poseidoniaceae archaeon]